jgi:uncharacterized membrane protein HdeD (DUF308 family)
MLRHAAKYWWVFLVRGICAILFGFLAYFQPAISLAALVLIIGAFWFADGIVAVIGAISERKQNESWWVTLLEGLFGMAVGIMTLISPGVTAVALVLYFAAWTLVTGVLKIVAAIRLRKEITGEFWLMLAGAFSILLAVLLFARPGAGALALLWMLAGFAIVFGVILVLLSFRLRGLAKA